MKIIKAYTPSIDSGYNKNWSVLQYDSAGEFLKDVQSVPMGSSTGQVSDSWNGTETMEDAIELAKHGWTEVAKEMNERLKVSLKNQDAQAIVKNIQDVAGYQVNVPLFMTGVPTNMIRQQRTMKKSRVINLVKPMGANAFVSHNEYMKSGIEAMTVVAGLERCGYSVNLYIMSNSARSGCDSISTLVKIKNANERLNVSKLAFYLASVAVHRRFNFTIYTKYSEQTGCGRAMKYNATGSTQNHKVASQIVEDLTKKGVLRDCYVLSGVHSSSSASSEALAAKEQVELIKREFEK